MSITICDTHLARTVRYLSLTFEPVYFLSFCYSIFRRDWTKIKRVEIQHRPKLWFLPVLLDNYLILKITNDFNLILNENDYFVNAIDLLSLHCPVCGARLALQKCCFFCCKLKTKIFWESFYIPFYCTI